MMTLAGIGAYHELKKIVVFTESSLNPLSFHTTIEDDDLTIEIHHIEFNESDDETNEDDEELSLPSLSPSASVKSKKRSLSEVRGESISSPNSPGNQQNIADMKSFVDNTNEFAVPSEDLEEEVQELSTGAEDESRRDELDAASYYSDDFVLVRLEENVDEQGSITLTAHVSYVEPANAFSSFGGWSDVADVDPLFSVIIMNDSVEQKNWRGSVFEKLSKTITGNLVKEGEDDGSGSFFNII